MTSKTEGGNTTNYRYDVTGRMVGVDTNGDLVDDQTYVYNSDGQRVRVSEGGNTTLYHIDTQNPTGLPQVIEEGVDDNADNILIPSEIDTAYTLGLDLISQHNAADGLLVMLYDAHLQHHAKDSL